MGASSEESPRPIPAPDDDDIPGHLQRFSTRGNGNYPDPLPAEPVAANRLSPDPGDSQDKKSG